MIGSKWTTIRALGEDNLVQAIEDYEANGWEVFQTMFVGIKMVEHTLSGKQQPISHYIILVRRKGAVQNGR